LSEDPLGFKAGQINHYVYCSNNPIICNDPFGLADIFTGEVSLGARAGFNVKAGPIVSFNGLINLGSINLSTGADLSPEGLPIPTVRQEFGGGVTFFDRFSFSPTTSREASLPIFGGTISTPLEALNGTSFSPTNYSGGFSAGSTSTSQSINNFENDTVIGLGAQFGLGFDFSVNLTEAGRQFGGFLFDTFNPASAASGGFVLYPNKINTNTIQQVYSK